MFEILLINGPNLNAVGQREPHIYGYEGLDKIPDYVQEVLQNKIATINMHFFQSNHEGAIIDRLEQARHENIDGIVLNAGALTHTSLALADCLAWIQIPFVEVHISNVHARTEEIRHKTLIGRHAMGIISGFGLHSYALGVQALVCKLEQKYTV